MANIVWTGAAADGNFNNPANWNPRQVPGSGDNATIDPNAATAINLSNDAIGSLTTDKFVTLNVTNNTNFTIGSSAGGATTFSNAGTLALNSTGSGTDFIIGAPTLSLTGTGTVLLSNNTQNYIVAGASGDVLNNVSNLIEGAGQIGGGSLAFVNGKAGVVDANDTNSLVLNTGGSVITNSGLLEATSTGGLYIESVVNNAAGNIAAHGANVYLSGADILGGTLTASAGGTIYQINTSGDDGSTLDGTTNAVVLKGPFVVNNDCGLGLLGTIDNLGTIALASSGNLSDLYVGTTTGTIASTVTLTGAGTVMLSDNSGNAIYGAIAGDTLVNVNNTIEGAGQLNGSLVLVNDAAGIIDATGTNTLYLNTGANTITNSGLLEATGTGGLTIESVVNDAATGRITAAGGNVDLFGADILGGMLTASAGGTIYQTNTSGYNGSTLDGTTNQVVLKGPLVVNNDCGLGLLGTIDNLGTISLASSGSLTDLDIGVTSGTTASTVTLTGAGTVVLSDNTGNSIVGGINGDTLVNVNNTIEGAGQLSGSLVLVNGAEGIVNANGTNALVLNTGANTITNSGLIEATGSGGLVIECAVNDGATGLITAAGGNIYLNGADILGGTLTTNSGATIFQENSSGLYGATLDGTASKVVLNGQLIVNNDCGLNLLGTIDDTGTITLNSAGSETDLDLGVASGSMPSTVTLTGGGTILLTNNESNYLFAGIAGNTLLNQGDTITGAGTIASSLILMNSGIVEASDSNPLYVASSTLVNSTQGQLLAINGGSLVLEGASITNSGLIEAQDGSSVTFSTGATLTNDSAAGTLTGGTYGAIANGHGATLTITGTAVTTDAADLILSGAGSEITFAGTTIETSLKTIDKTGELQVLAKRGYTTKEHITNSGTVMLGGGTLKAGELNDKAGSVLSGFGTLSAKFSDSGSVVATGGELVLAKNNTITGTLSGTGTLGFGGTTTLNTGTLLDVGHIALLDKATLNIAASVSFAGTFDVVGTASVAGAGAFSNTGLFEATSKGAATISDPFANSGTISVAAGDSLAFSGGLANTGLILDSGTFTDTAALTGGSLTLGGSGTAATIASGAGAGPSTLATLTTAGGALNTSGTTLTVTGDYNNTAAGTGNSYTPFAGVTGTIDAQGTKLSVIGVNGTTITSVNGTLTITIAAGGMAQFEVENTGAAGSAALRGALQTTVNGGHITGTALSGSGVTAGNFGPIAAGSNSSIYTIDYSSGALNNESIHLASDFANVAGLTIDIVAGKAEAVTPDAVHSGLLQHDTVPHDWLSVLHQG